MKSISGAVKKILEQNLDMADLLARNLLNRSEYARNIKGDIENLTMKEVTLKSIVVALSRLESEIKGVRVPKYVEIDQLSIHSPIIDIIFDKSEANLQSLAVAVKKITSTSDGFFTFSTSTREISITTSEDLEKDTLECFSSKPKAIRRNLSAVSIRFSDKLIPEPNIGLYFHRLIGKRGIPLDKVVTTNNEFTLVFGKKYLQDMLDVLSQNKNMN